MIVIDTNIFIAALLKDSTTREILITSNNTFLFPEIIFQEIEEHKRELIRKSGISENEYEELIKRLLKSVIIVPDKLTLMHLEEAIELIGETDKDDAPFIATALALKAAIWTNDQHFQKQKKIKTLTTKDLIKKPRRRD